MLLHFTGIWRPHRESTTNTPMTGHLNRKRYIIHHICSIHEGSTCSSLMKTGKLKPTFDPAK